MTDKAQIQTVQGFMGSLPNQLLAVNLNLSDPSLRANANTLRKDEWKALDAALLDVAQARLVAVADLRAAGLTRPLGGLGTIFSEYERLTDMNPASTSMSPVSDIDEDAVTFDLQTVPVPITSKGFRFNIRQLLASRNRGESLDVTQVRVATRKVADSLEDMVFNGNSIVVNGSPIYGFTTHPQRNTGTADGDFGTIGNIYGTFLNMVSALRADNFYGPYNFYVAQAQFDEMEQVYTDGSGQRAIDRVLRIEGINSVKPTQDLTAGSLVGVNMSSDTVDLAIAQDIVVVEWAAYGGMQFHFKVMGAMVPRVKADATNQCGVVHYTGA